MKYFYLLLSGLLPLFCSAQSNFKSGYVITNAQDTLKGFVDYREWDYSPKTISFKASTSAAKATIYQPGDIHGFGVSGLESYTSYTGKISLDKTSSPDVPTGLDTSSITTSAFFKNLIINDKLSLYQLKDEVKNRFFISLNGGSPSELSYHLYMSPTENQAIKSGVFKGQLKYAASLYGTDNANLQRHINSAAYSETDLYKIVNEIDGLTAKNKTYEPKSAARFFIGGGANVISTAFYGVNNFSNSPKVTEVKPAVSAGVDIFRNSSVRQLVFRGELTYWYTSRSFTSTSTYNSFTTQTETYGIKQQTLAITPQLLYNFYNASSARIFFGAGMAFNISNYSNKDHTIAYTSTGSPSTQIAAPYDYKSLWFNFPIELGAMFNNKVELNVKYYIPGDFANYTYFNVQSNVVSATIHYLF